MIGLSGSQLHSGMNGNGLSQMNNQLRQMNANSYKVSNNFNMMQKSINNMKKDLGTALGTMRLMAMIKMPFTTAISTIIQGMKDSFGELKEMVNVSKSFTNKGNIYDLRALDLASTGLNFGDASHAQQVSRTLESKDSYQTMLSAGFSPELIEQLKRLNRQGNYSEMMKLYVKEIGKIKLTIGDDPTFHHLTEGLEKLEPQWRDVGNNLNKYLRQLELSKSISYKGRSGIEGAKDAWDKVTIQLKSAFDKLTESITPLIKYFGNLANSGLQKINSWLANGGVDKIKTIIEAKLPSLLVDFMHGLKYVAEALLSIGAFVTTGDTSKKLKGMKESIGKELEAESVRRADLQTQIKKAGYNVDNSTVQNMIKTTAFWDEGRAGGQLATDKAIKDLIATLKELSTRDPTIRLDVKTNSGMTQANTK